MSVGVSWLIWNQFPQGGSRMLVMLALADIGNDAGENIYPGIDYLSRKVRMSPRQIQRILQGLAKDGFIDLIEPGTPGRRIIEGRYRINLKSMTSCPALLRKKHDISEKKDDISNKKHDISRKKDDIETAESRATQGSGEGYVYTYIHNKQGDSAPGFNLHAYIAQLKKHLEKNPDDKATAEALSAAEKQAAEQEQARQAGAVAK